MAWACAGSSVIFENSGWDAFAPGELHAVVGCPGADGGISGRALRNRSRKYPHTRGLARAVMLGRAGAEGHARTLRPWANT